MLGAIFSAYCDLKVPLAALSVRTYSACHAYRRTIQSIPVGKGVIVWISALPDDFDPALRPDLVFTRVNTERLYSIVLGNLGVHEGAAWSSCLVKGGTRSSV